MIRAIVLHPKDNVATLIADGKAGDEVQLQGREGTVALAQDVNYGHKIALVPMPAGAEVVKYGEIVGRMTAGAAVGEHVHVHNVESLRGRGDLAAAARAK